MKFLLVLGLLALAAAEEDKNQEKKTQAVDAVQNASTLPQSASPLLNGQVFPAATFGNVFGTKDPVSTLAYTGFNGNLSPIQSVNPDFFAAPVSVVPGGGIPAFPVTRAVLPGTSAVVNGLQSAFPVSGGAFPAAIGGIASQFPAIVGGIISAAGGVPGVTGGALDANAATSNAGIGSVPTATYRFLAPESLAAIQTQGLQTGQAIGIPTVPAFASGAVTPLAGGIFQGQTIPSAVFQGQNIPAGVLKNPTGTPSAIPNVPGLTTGNISSGPLTNVFRQ